MELTKNDLLKLVTYFEGEIQARDVAVAALKVFCHFNNYKYVYNVTCLELILG